MTGYLDRVNRTKVNPELLVEVLQIHATMPPEDRGVFETRVLRIFELLKSKGVRGDNRIAALATAIDFRLTALARLERDAKLRGWSILLEAGVSSISADALKAAAEEPLIENAEGAAVFDAESFRRRALTNVEPDGRA